MTKNTLYNGDHHVDLLMYCFHESLPASLPPPVAFSPPDKQQNTVLYMQATCITPQPITMQLVSALTKCTTDLGSTSWNVNIDNSTVRPSRATFTKHNISTAILIIINCSAIAHINRELRTLYLKVVIQTRSLWSQVGHHTQLPQWSYHAAANRKLRNNIAFNCDNLRVSYKAQILRNF